MTDGCGPKPLWSYAQLDPDMSSWKTFQPSFETDGLSGLSSPTFTASGSMRNGRLYERPTMALPTPVNGSTSWPTPRASMGGHGIAWSRAESGKHRSQLEDYLAWQHISAGGKRVRGWKPNPEWTDWLMGFPPRWTDCDAQETPSSHRSPITLAD